MTDALANKAGGKAKKLPCPKCAKWFLRLKLEITIEVKGQPKESPASQWCLRSGIIRAQCIYCSVVPPSAGSAERSYFTYIYLRNNTSCKNVSLLAELSTYHQYILCQQYLHPHLLHSLLNHLPTGPHLQHSCPVPSFPPLLPCTQLPSTPEQWAEVDTFVLANNTPAVLLDVNTMQHPVTHGLYTYLVTRFGAVPANRHHQHY